MSASQKSAIRRFFTQRPQTRIDFLVAWICMSAVPVVMWPILGFVTGDMSEAFTRTLPTMIIVPIVTGLVFTYIYRSQKQHSSLPERRNRNPED